MSETLNLDAAAVTETIIQGRQQGVIDKQKAASRLQTALAADHESPQNAPSSEDDTMPAVASLEELTEVTTQSAYQAGVNAALRVTIGADADTSDAENRDDEAWYDQM